MPTIHDYNLKPLERFRLMHASPTEGGITLPIPPENTWSEYQEGHERRLARIHEQWEAERLKRETGLEIFSGIPFSEFDGSSVLRVRG